MFINLAYLHIDCSSVPAFLCITLYYISRKCSPTASEAAHFTAILNENFSFSQKRTLFLHFSTRTSGQDLDQVAPPPLSPTAPTPSSVLSKPPGYAPGIMFFVFLRIDANTRILNLAGNQLTSIPAGFLASYPDVQELYFENNRIEGRFFSGRPSLHFYSDFIYPGKAVYKMLLSL